MQVQEALPSIWIHRGKSTEVIAASIPETQGSTDLSSYLTFRITTSAPFSKPSVPTAFL